jgi:hypothetical protein
MTPAQALRLRVGTRITSTTGRTGILIERSRTTFLVQWSDGIKACYSYRLVHTLEVYA